MQSVQIQKLTSSGLTTSYTTAAETAVELLGAHEFYWWGWGQQLLAKLSDGASFKFYQISNEASPDDFDTIATQAPAAQTDVQKIEQAQKNLFHLQYKTQVPPVCVQDVCVFYIVNESNVGKLQFWKWNAISNYFEMKSEQDVASSVSGNWETDTSLLRTDAGVIFKENNEANIYYFSVTDYTYTQSSVTKSWGSVTATGVVSNPNLFFKQTRDDWLNYDATADATPTIVSYVGNDDYLIVWTWDLASTTITA